jgi:hypothetical protein
VNGLGSEIWENYSSMVKKNNPDRPWMMFKFLRADTLPYLTDVSGIMAQYYLVYIMILLCRLISNDMIVVETVCLWTIFLCYFGGCDPLVVNVIHWLVAVCY